ncbi:hypothetical protein HPB50_027612 [Hyalomma asiaticum]|nr:hypothetical protein HPB50_027612 [Hyalomma asiaticum]
MQGTPQETEESSTEEKEANAGASNAGVWAVRGNAGSARTPVQHPGPDRLLERGRGRDPRPGPDRFQEQNRNSQRSP